MPWYDRPLYLERVCEQHVLWFDVPVYEPSVVDDRQTRHEGLQYEGDSELLSQSPPLGLEVRIYVTLRKPA